MHYRTEPKLGAEPEKKSERQCMCKSCKVEARVEQGRAMSEKGREGGISRAAELGESEFKIRSDRLEQGKA